MNLSNMIAKMIMEMIDDEGSTEIQRNEMAQTLGCVPSQINYVISSRFTPERGYIVESRRGGGGYIRISRVVSDRSVAVMGVINSVGDEIDEKSCRAHIYNLHYQSILNAETAKLMTAATSDAALRPVEAPQKDRVRASIFKYMLLSTTK